MGPHRAFIVGGGLAGMTVAKELTERGFKVLLCEAGDQLGGKAGAEGVAPADLGRWGGGEPPLGATSIPHEHGYHIFPGWYQNTRRILEEIGVGGSLIDLHRFYHLRRRYSPRPIGRVETFLRGIARRVRPTLPPAGPLQPRMTSFEETWPLSNIILNIIDGPTRPSHSLVYFYALLDLAGRQLSQADHLDRISANGFLSARPYVSEDVARFQHQTVLQASAIPNYEISAMTVQKLTRCWFQTPSPMVSILPRDLQAGFIAPFATHLTARRVKTLWDAKVVRLHPELRQTVDRNGHNRIHTCIMDLGFADGSKLSERLPLLDPGGPALSASDVFVLATPYEVTLALVDRDVDALERRKEVARTTPLTDLAYLRRAPMAGLQLYCDRPVPGLPREHVFLTGSRFGLSLIDVTEHWPTIPGASTVLSLIASDFEPLRAAYESSRGSEREAQHSVAKLLIDEVAEYIDLPPCTYTITPNFDRQLFLNTVGAWPHRPETRTRFANLYVAGDYCQSQADLTCMESAVGSAMETAGQILSDKRVTHTVHARPLELPDRWKLLALKALMAPAVAPFGAWNATERALRRLTMNWRKLVVSAPYSHADFATNFRATEALGMEFFRVYAELRNYDHTKRARAGLMPSLDDLASKVFEPGKVHPLIREFYERTWAFDMKIDIHWHHVFKPLGWLYQQIIARPMQNLVIPQDAMEDLDSWLETIDKDWDGEADYTIWIRVAKGSTLPIYVGAYRTYRSRHDDLSYVSVVFPWPIGNLTTVLVPTNLDGDGLQLYTVHEGARDAGVYVLFTGERRFTMLPTPLTERFQLRVSGDSIHVDHHTWAWGMRAITITYDITRTRPRDEATWNALAEAVETADQRW
jgi:hypothetical protein